MQKNVYRDFFHEINVNFFGWSQIKVSNNFSSFKIVVKKFLIWKLLLMKTPLEYIEFYFIKHNLFHQIKMGGTLSSKTHSSFLCNLPMLWCKYAFRLRIRSNCLLCRRSLSSLQWFDGRLLERIFDYVDECKADSILQSFANLEWLKYWKLLHNKRKIFSFLKSPEKYPANAKVNSSCCIQKQSSGLINRAYYICPEGTYKTWKDNTHQSITMNYSCTLRKEQLRSRDKIQASRKISQLIKVVTFRIIKHLSW